MTDLPLAALFPKAAEADWRAAVDKALKGGDFEKKLVHRTADGIAIQPLYPRRSDAALVAPARAGQRWRLTQRVDHPDIDAAHAQALADLEGGADSLALVFSGSGAAHGQGIAVETVRDLAATLEGVKLDLISVRLEQSPEGRANAVLMAALVARLGLVPERLAIDFGLDPIGLFARSGLFSAPWDRIGARLVETIAGLSSLGFRGPFISCDGRAVHDAGGSEAQELAYVLGAAVAYLRATETGLGLEKAEAALSFTLAIDADQNLGIAKLRALRRLMARVQEACGLPQRPITIHAETAWRMLTRRDPGVNMLRNTIAVFSAGVGGADSVTVLPHSLAQCLPDGFARRVARNAQHVLMEEANLWRVVDPAAGSGGIESLTDEIAAKAWALFQESERQGGLIDALANGSVQRQIAEVRAARDKAIATRRIPITGASEFPNLNERGTDVVDAPAAPRKAKVAATPSAQDPSFAEMLAAFGKGATKASLRPSLQAAAKAEPLPSFRLAEPYEALRDRSDKALAAKGVRPRVFMANLGPISAFTARTTFARALFEAGGVEAVTNDGFAEGVGTDLVALTDAFKASGARLACLCSSDAVYAAEATDAAMALIASGAAKIYIAGRLPEMDAQLAQAGVTGAVYVGCDVLKTLGEALDVAGS